MLRHAVRINSLTEIALTKLDVLDTFDEVRVCVGYSLNGKPLDGYPDDSELLGEITPNYVDLPGWKEEIRACRALSVSVQNAILVWCAHDRTVFTSRNSRDFFGSIKVLALFRN
jgi:adenylosuccinate synthase